MPDKKVLYIHTGQWPSSSPSIVFVTGTVWGLSHHVPTVLVIKNNSNTSTPEIFQSITGKTVPDNLDIIRIGAGETPVSHAEFYRKALYCATSYIENDEVGAVITRSIGFLPYLTYLRLRYRVPCFFEPHDFFTNLSQRTDIKQTFIIRKNSLFERMFLNHIDGLICLTESQRNLFTRYYPSLPAVIARSGLFSVMRSTAPRENMLCYSGSLEPHKGVDILLLALSLTRTSHVNLFVIGGKDAQEISKCKSQAKEYGIEERIRISGWINHADVGSSIDRCIGGIVPLTDTFFNRFITSPLKIFDYFSRSLPVIASALPPVSELVEDGKHGILFTPGNPESLAQAIDKYISEDMFSTMSPQVESHAKQFLWNHRGEKIVNFIEECTHKSL